jgi:hypothetical protein
VRAALLSAQPCVGRIAGISGLFLSDVKEITPTVAGILARHRAGDLALSGLRTLPADVARALVGHPLLALDRVEAVDDRVADILASFGGASLSLRGLRRASPAARAALAANPAIMLPVRAACR